jgi:hypothetical protein
VTSYINGTLSCFCDGLYKKRGLAVMFDEFRSDGEKLDTAINPEMPPKVEQICLKYVTYDKLSDAYYWLASVAILLVNLVFYMIVDPLIRQIGLLQRRTESVMAFVTMTILLYVDLCIMPIMLDMNLVEFDEYHITKSAFQGKHTDMGALWYTDTGAGLIRTMIIYALQTPVDFVVDWIVWNICRNCAIREHAAMPRTK